MGVAFHQNSGLWRARIHIDGRQTDVGYYKNKHQAAVTYNKADLKHYGEFAKLNLIKRK